MRLYGVVVLMLFFCGSASAQSRLSIADAYEGKDPWAIQVRTIMLDWDDGIVAAAVSVAMPWCSGGFTGTGRLQGTVLDLRPYRKEEGSRDCVVTMTFDASGKTATLAESGCSYYHGAQCEFAGKVRASR